MIYLKDSKFLQNDIQNNSIHAVITDPPYGLGVSWGKEWDKILPPQEIWDACFNVLRPGGYCVAFGHPKTYHRLCCQLEDAGFEIKDCLCWCYATGNPRPLNIDKSMLKNPHTASEGQKWEGWANNLKGSWESIVIAKKHDDYADCIELLDLIHKLGVIDEKLEDFDIKEYYKIVNNKVQLAQSGKKLLKKFGISRQYFVDNNLLCKLCKKDCIQWEPIVFAQKPIEKTYAENIIKHKVGGLNIDACRIPYASEEDKQQLLSFLHFEGKNCGDPRYFSVNTGGKKQVNIHPSGRWPANLFWLDPLFAEYDHIFMIPKPSRNEKCQYNTHTTVKPIRLMERLISLVTPNPAVVKEDVTILDPFAGSGSTGVACKILKRKFIGYEKDSKSFEIAQKRLKVKRKIDLFG